VKVQTIKMSKLQKICKGFAQVLVAACVLMTPVLSQAEHLGTTNGRTADFTRLPDLSVEIHFNTGDFSNVDYQNLGLRANYRLSPGILLFGDLGLTELGFRDGTAIGFGAFYGLQGIFENIDAAVKASYHTADYGSRVVGVDVIALEFLFSGLEPIADNGLMWYANAGIHRSDFEVDSETDFGLGGGVVLPVSSGEAFVGLDFIDDLVIGVGYRHYFQ